MKTTTLSAMALIGVMTASSTNAAVMYTDRAAWRTAAGGGTGDIAEDFTGVSSNLNLPVAAGGIPFDAGEFVISETGDGSAIVDDGRLVTNLDSVGSNDTIIFAFDSAVRALGFDVSTPASILVGGTISFATNIVGENGSYTLPGAGFRGFLFAAPITTFTIDHAAVGGGSQVNFGYHNIDNVEAFTGSVPEPASLALLGLGLAGIGYQRRKRSA